MQERPIRWAENKTHDSKVSEQTSLNLLDQCSSTFPFYKNGEKATRDISMGQLSKANEEQAKDLAREFKLPYYDDLLSKASVAHECQSRLNGRDMSVEQQRRMDAQKQQLEKEDAENNKIIAGITGTIKDKMAEALLHSSAQGIAKVYDIGPSRDQSDERYGHGNDPYNEPNLDRRSAAIKNALQKLPNIEIGITQESVNGEYHDFITARYKPKS